MELPMVLPQVLYWSHAPESVYEVLRRCAAGIAEVVTLERDDAQLRAQALPQADVVIVAAQPIRSEDINLGRKLRLVHHQGVGYQDTVPVATLCERNIRLALTPEGTTTGVAEHTVLLMLAVCKRLSHVDSELRQGRWHVNTYRSESRELSGMRVGYIGFGRIGQAVAARLHAFGAHAVFYDPGIPQKNIPIGDTQAIALGLSELLATSDIVSLHLPFSSEAKHLINEVTLRTMKRGAILINASRGGLVDEIALATALQSGHLAGAGLDCFESEPVSANHPLFSFHNVVVTPHSAAATIDALETKMTALFGNIARWQRGAALAHEVKLK
jgi:phosphoglycerate dehydrogenase-like enzyme